MGLFDFFKKKEEKPAPAAPAKPAVPASIPVDFVVGNIYQPLSGNVITLEEIPDPVFNSGALGPGCGIEPTEEIVYAPIDATVSTVAETKHAVGLTGSNNVEMLIHVGLDTVNMQGKGFEVLVEEDQQVKAGQPLLKFSKQAIKDAGYSDTTAVLVINAADFGGITLDHTGPSQAGSKLMTLG